MVWIEMMGRTDSDNMDGKYNWFAGLLSKNAAFKFIPSMYTV